MSESSNFNHSFQIINSSSMMGKYENYIILVNDNFKQAIETDKNIQDNIIDIYIELVKITNTEFFNIHLSNCPLYDYKFYSNKENFDELVKKYTNIDTAINKKIEPHLIETDLSLKEIKKKSYILTKTSGYNTCLSRNTQLYYLAQALYYIYCYKNNEPALSLSNKNKDKDTLIELLKILKTLEKNKIQELDNIKKLYDNITPIINEKMKPLNELDKIATRTDYSFQSKYLKYKTKYLELKKLKNM